MADGLYQKKFSRGLQVYPKVVLRLVVLKGCQPSPI